MYASFLPLLMLFLVLPRSVCVKPVQLITGIRIAEHNSTERRHASHDRNLVDDRVADDIENSVAHAGAWSDEGLVSSPNNWRRWPFQRFQTKRSSRGLPATSPVGENPENDPCSASPRRKSQVVTEIGFSAGRHAGGLRQSGSGAS